ncbi:hypothetical protein GTA08_BOTSDO05812 [Neofusicoccum parvum]|uniref:Uncharacterized protein n=1 Tax=Neofusicoccum parvum TaxID=310453 RepID=A0ACB5RYL6_9PEZI|nr:hypothetical protein GTA08_BOTSDO05812 [Neofusicoccum parvum]
MTGFSADTSLKDIIEHIKGGTIIEVYRYNERAVRVSFLRGTDAQAFRTFARRHDIYINSKRVHVDWADRQFHLNDHLYNRIASNRATRILRLRNGKRFVTEHDIQNDMEHIHNLVIIDIKVQGNDFIVYTNSVQRCGYARTCMASRMPYRVLKLEFVPDDCAAPLPQRTHPNFFDAVQPTSQVQLKPRKSANFYEILNSDALDDDGDCEALQHVNRRDSAVSDYSSDICRPRSADSDAISYC